MMNLIFYTGKDNLARLFLFVDGVEIDYTALTDIKLKYSGGEFDSINNPEAMQINQDHITLTLGYTALTEGIYSMTLIAYDPEHPGGIVWSPILNVKIVSA